MNDELYLNESVKVVAIFGDSTDICQPLRFKRKNGHEINISEVGLRHPNMHGKRMLHVFDVTDGTADYRLEFDGERLTWALTREADHYAA